MVACWVLAVSTAVYAFRGYVLGGMGPRRGGRARLLAGRQQRPPYDQPPGYLDAYLYSPLFKQLVQPFAMLPFKVFFGLWMVVEAAIFVWLLAPLSLRWAIRLLTKITPGAWAWRGT